MENKMMIHLAILLFAAQPPPSPVQHCSISSCQVPVSTPITITYYMIYHTVNRLRSFLTSSHSIIQSSTHPVIRSFIISPFFYIVTDWRTNNIGGDRSASQTTNNTRILTSFCCLGGEPGIFPFNFWFIDLCKKLGRLHLYVKHLMKDRIIRIRLFTVII